MSDDLREAVIATLTKGDWISPRLAGDIADAALAAARPVIERETREAERTPWLAAELAKIAALKPNWDGYGADPIAPETCEALRRALIDLPSACIVPGADGSLQAEWHTAEASIELCVMPAAIRSQP
jgi:hypothetical protein